jgi:hypothetical protein
MEERRTPTAAKLDEQRRDAAARTLGAWIVEHERLKASGTQALRADVLDALTSEALGLLVRLQVCRGLEANAVAQGLARSLAGFARQYEQRAARPDAAERELDASRAATLRDLMAVLGGMPAQEPPADRRN